MKASVIIPVYNVEEYISDCLKSVICQTYKNIEVVIVNDRTTDNSMDIVRQVLKDEQPSFQVKIVNHEVNMGLSAARNTGIRHSTGDYLYFLDSDDEITLDCIESLMKIACKHDVDMVVGDYTVTGTSLPFPELRLGNSTIRSRRRLLKAFMEKEVYVMAWNKLTKKSFIVRNQLYFKEGAIHEDCLWNFQCGCKISSLAVLKVPTYIYKVRPKSIMTSISVEADFKAYLDILNSIIDYASEKRLSANKYIYSFIEEEKFFLDYQYCAKEESPNYLVEHFFDLLDKSTPSLIRIFFWGIFKRDWRIRDAHYFLRPNTRRDYYLKMMHIRWNRKNGRIKKAFDKWYLRIILSYILKKDIKNFAIN